MKAIIFDLDGTLLNSLTDIAESVNSILSKNNLPEHPISAYNYFVGYGIEKLVENALPKDFDKNNFSSFLTDVKTEYKKRQILKTKPYDGITEMLKELNKRKISISILSNKPDEFTKLVVNHFFADIKFDIVLGSRTNVPKKPNPQAVYEIINELNITKENFFFVGDTATDMQTSVNGGITGIGVSWGFREVAELNSSGAKFIIDEPEEIFDVIYGYGNR